MVNRSSGWINHIALVELDALHSKETMQNLLWGEHINVHLNDTLAASVQIMQLYYRPCMIAVGCLGNLLACITLSGTKVRKFSCSPYLAAMAFTDMLFLFVLLTAWLAHFEINIYNTGGWCQAITYISYVCTFLPVWFYVAVSIDRFIFVTCVETRDKLCTTLRSKIVISILAIIAVVVYLNISLLSGVIITETRKICVPLPDFAKHMQALDKLDTFINLLIPNLVVFLMTMLIAKQILFCRNTDETRTYSSRRRHSQSNGRPETEVHFTKMLLAVFIVFILLNLPNNILRVCVMFRILHTEDYTISRKIILWQQILLHLYFTRYAVNFFLYYIFSKTFRQNFKSMFVNLYRKCAFKPGKSIWHQTSGRKSMSSNSSVVMSNNSTHLQFIESSSV